MPSGGSRWRISAKRAENVYPRASGLAEVLLGPGGTERPAPLLQHVGTEWFLGCLGRAIDGAHTTLNAVLAKARFWESSAGVPLNARQRLVVNRLLDGFEGKLTSSKYASLTKCSQDTAARDIASLVERGVLARNSGGRRSTSYAPAGMATDAGAR